MPVGHNAANTRQGKTSKACCEGEENDYNKAFIL